MYNKGIERGIDTRGVIDHGFIKSIYFRDPNGYVIELTCPIERLDKTSYKDNLNLIKNWQENK